MDRIKWPYHIVCLAQPIQSAFATTSRHQINVLTMESTEDQPCNRSGCAAGLMLVIELKLHSFLEL